jgi:hypothetical protein
MALDAFTINAIIVVLILALLMLGVMLKSSRDERGRLEALARPVPAPQPTVTEPEARGEREFCGAIHRLYPNARVGIDFRVSEGSDGPRISQWLLAAPEPTAAEIAAARDAYREEQATRGYREARRAEYPSVGDQLDALFKARQGDPSELAAVDARIREVKARHPKTGEC